MSISAQQIKAARAMLDWTQKDLARLSGISLPTIATIETATANPRAETLTVLRATFENHEIDFLDDPGVRIRREPFGVKVLTGREGIFKVWKDIEETYVAGGELLLAYLNDREWQPLVEKELEPMLQRRKKLSITVRVLVREREDVFHPQFNNCRIIPPSAFAQVPYYVYGNKVAVMKIINPVRIILIENPLVADSFRQQFNFQWEMGQPLTA